MQVDHEAEPPVNLKEQCCFSAGQHLAKDRDVLDSQLHDRFFDRSALSEIALRLIAGHRVVRLYIFLDQSSLRVVDFDQIGRVLFVDWPELLCFGVSEVHVRCDDLLLLGPQVPP